jgi:hypothetical protein
VKHVTIYAKVEGFLMEWVYTYAMYFKISNAHACKFKIAVCRRPPDVNECRNYLIDLDRLPIQPQQLQ